MSRKVRAHPGHFEARQVEFEPLKDVSKRLSVSLTTDVQLKQEESLQTNLVGAFTPRYNSVFHHLAV